MKALQDWLSHLETVHSSGLIDMGLERVGEVKKCTNLVPQYPVVVVADTNGKGPVCVYLSHIYREVDFKIGTLTSPHLPRRSERIAISTQPVSGDLVVSSFERVEAARGEIPSMYFEFSTLAAIDIFMRENVDVMILEVGLGGRSDAVNVSDGNCSVVTSVNLGHQVFLGDTVEQVGLEKAGVFRSGESTVCSQNPASEPLVKHAEEIGTKLLMIQRDFDFASMESIQWSYRFHPQLSDGRSRSRNSLPSPALRGAYQLPNAACAPTVLEYLSNQLPVDIGAIRHGLLLVEDPGRFRVLSGHPLVVLDVSHNPRAARALRRSLINLAFAQKRTAVLSMLSDKGTDGVLEAVKSQFGERNIAPLDIPHGMTVEALQAKLAEHDIDNISVFETIAAAYRAVLAKATENDRIIVFSSFHTVVGIAAVLKKH